MRELRAMFVRDARLALSFPFRFWIQWLSVLISVGSFYFVSQLVPASSRLGVGGHRATYFSYVIVNVAFVGFQSTALASFANSIRGDQLYGTLEAILATPARLAHLVLSAGAWPFAITLLQVALTLALASFAGLDLGHADPLATLAFLALTLATMSSIGVLSAAAVMLFKQPGPTDLLVGGAASLLGGVLFPIALLPLPLRILSWLMPITHALNGIRGALAGAQLTALAPDALWLTAATAVLLPLSLVVFAYAVARAKFDGTLALH